MSEKLKEQLSAMLDDELDEQEYELLIHRLKQDRDLQSMWSRYQVVGEVMRQNLVNTAPADLAHKISQQIDHEPELEASDGMQSRGVRMLKPVAGLAIAASVAAMAVVGMQNVALNQNPDTSVPRLVQTEHVSNIRRVSGTHWDMKQPETEMRLNGYLMNHSEYTSNISLQGMINYARIAGYDSQH